METNAIAVDVEKFMKLFKCMLCGKYMRPDFTNCRYGHATCKSCRNERVCAYCRLRSEQFRNHTLKMIFMSVTFPCNNADRGCEVKLRGDHIVEHEERCKFGENEESLDVEIDKIEIRE